MEVACLEPRYICPQAATAKGGGEDVHGGGIEGLETNGINHVCNPGCASLVVCIPTEKRAAPRESVGRAAGLERGMR